MKATASSSQRVQLFARGAPIGWLGENNRQWCVVTDQGAAISIEPYVYANGASGYTPLTARFH